MAKPLSDLDLDGPAPTTPPSAPVGAVAPQPAPRRAVQTGIGQKTLVIPFAGEQPTGSERTEGGTSTVPVQYVPSVQIQSASPDRGVQVPVWNPAYDRLYGIPEAVQEQVVGIVSAAIPRDTPAPPAGPSTEQQAALDLCAQELLVDISGTAGVGKTYVAKQLASDDSVLLCASTGIAAVNLGEGTTINAALGYFDTDDLKQKWLTGMLQMRLRGLRRSGIRTLVLDEKSMVNGDQLDFLVQALDDVNQTAGYDQTFDQQQGIDTPTRNREAMGLVLVGDFGQLPPVPDEHHETRKKKPLKYCFDAAHWDRFASHRVILQEIRRQTDRPFIEALHAVRRGDATSALQFFTQDRFTGELDTDFAGTTIFAKNDAVERFNSYRLSQLKTAPLTFTTVRTGKQRGDWKLVPDQLQLKVSALVMVLANKRIYAGEEDQVGMILYANGDLGTLEGAMEGGGWRVRLQRTGEVVAVEPITRQWLIPLEASRRKELQAQYGDQWIHWVDEKRRNEILGTVSYIPLRCAYGCTVHKTQGLTLDRVQIAIADPFFKQAGMLFVALSRCRSAEGLRVVGSQGMFRDRCTVEERVQPWL